MDTFYKYRFIVLILFIFKTYIKNIIWIRLCFWFNSSNYFIYGLLYWIFTKRINKSFDDNKQNKTNFYKYLSNYNNKYNIKSLLDSNLWNKWCSNSNSICIYDKIYFVVN